MGELQAAPRDIDAQNEHEAMERVCGGPLAEPDSLGSFALKCG
jgi:hypothetical protein